MLSSQSGVYARSLGRQSHDRRPFFWKASSPKGRGDVLPPDKGGHFGGDRGGRLGDRAPVSRLGRADRLASVNLDPGDDLARRDAGDAGQVAALSGSIFWLTSGPSRCSWFCRSWLRSGLGFWGSLGVVIAGTLALYAAMFWAGPRLGSGFEFERRSSCFRAAWT